MGRLVALVADHWRRSASSWPWVARGLIGLAFLLRAYGLDSQSLWSDESITLVRSSLPLPTMLQQLPVEHAPLYFVVMNGWLRLAGSSDMALRYPSLLAGVTVVALAMALARRLFGSKPSLLLGLLLTIHPLHIWYSQEARMYALVSATGLAALWALTVALSGSAVRPWLAYATLTAATLYLHYYGGLILVIGLVFGLLELGQPTLGSDAQTGREPYVGGIGRWCHCWRSPRARDRLKALLLAELAVALLLLPWLPRALGVLGFPGWRPPVSARELIEVFVARSNLGRSVAPQVGLTLGAVYSGVAFGGLAAMVADLRAGRHRRGAQLVLVSLAVTSVAVLGVVCWRADIHERYLMPVWPFFSLLVAYGWWRLWQRSLFSGVLVLCFVLASNGLSLRNHYFNQAYAKPDYREYTSYIVENVWENDALVLYGPGYFLTRRYGGERLPKIYNLLSSSHRNKSWPELQRLLTAIAARHDSVWLAVAGREPGSVGRWFSEHGYLLEGGWRTGLLLYRYVCPADPEPPLARAKPLGGSRLAEVFGAVQAARPGKDALVLVAVGVGSPTDPSHTSLRVSARLVDPLGSVVAQQDVDLAPPDQSLRIVGGGRRLLATARLALRVPPAATRGVYEVRAVVYQAPGRPLVETRLARLALGSEGQSSAPRPRDQSGQERADEAYDD